MPVLAPALIPAADSGEIRIGGPEKYPLKIVVRPHTINNQPARGIAPFFFVSPPKSDRDRANPFNVRIYKNNKLNINKTVEPSLGLPVEVSG